MLKLSIHLKTLNKTALKKNNRISFRKIDPVLQAPNLLDIQKESYDWLTGVNDKKNSGIANVFSEIGEIQNQTKDMALSFGKYTFEAPANDIETCKKQDLTYSQTLFVESSFTNYNTGEIKNQTISLGELPKMTPNGTFIINGTERVVVSQIVRSPGVYFEKSVSPLGDYETYSAKIIPSRGAMLEFEIDKYGVLYSRLDRKRKQSATVFLKAIDIGVNEIQKHFKEYPMVLESLKNDVLKTKEDALIDIFRKNRPGDPVSVEAGAILLYNYFFNPRRYDLQPVGRYKVNKKLGLNVEKRVLTKNDIVQTIKYLISLYNGKKELKTIDGNTVLVDVDDIDNLANRRIRTSGELIQNQLRIGLSRVERSARERMTLQDADVITPNSLVNINPLQAVFKEFFGL
jgi:DNA-directed RNA polymerase subunit beta